MKWSRLTATTTKRKSALNPHDACSPRYTGMGYSILSGDSRSISLRYIDNLDAKMYMCEENYEKLELRKITEKKPFGLDNRIYKPNYENNLEPIGFKVKAEVLI